MLKKKLALPGFTVQPASCCVVRISYDGAVDGVPVGQLYLGFENLATSDNTDVFMGEICPAQITGAPLTVDVHFNSGMDLLSYQWQRSYSGRKRLLSPAGEILKSVNCQYKTKITTCNFLIIW